MTLLRKSASKSHIPFSLMANLTLLPRRVVESDLTPADIPASDMPASKKRQPKPSARALGIR